MGVSALASTSRKSLPSSFPHTVERSSPPPPSPERRAVSPLVQTRVVDSPRRVSTPGKLPLGVKFMAPVDQIRASPEISALQRRSMQDLAHAEATVVSTPPVKPRVELRKTPAPQRPLQRLPSPAQSRGQVSIRLASPATTSNLAMPARMAAVALLFLLGSLVFWREDTVAAGFCDTNSSTNARIEARTTSVPASNWVTSLVPRTLTTLDAWNLRPSCTPCPAHALCQNAEFISCTLDYVPRNHPWRLAGLLPLPLRCVPDTAKLVAVAEQASTAVKLMRQRRGEVVCSRRLEHARIKLDRGEAWVYGMEKGALMERLESALDDVSSPHTP